MIHLEIRLRRRTLLLLTLWPEPSEQGTAPEQRGIAALAAGEIAEPWRDVDAFGIRRAGT